MLIEYKPAVRALVLRLFVGYFFDWTHRTLFQGGDALSISLPIVYLSLGSCIVPCILIAPHHFGRCRFWLDDVSYFEVLLNVQSRSSTPNATLDQNAPRSPRS